MSYPGWVSMPCNLWRLTRTASSEAGRSLALVAIIAVIAITMTTYTGDLSLEVGLDRLIFTAPSSPWSPRFLTQKAPKCDASFLVAVLIISPPLSFTAVSSIFPPHQFKILS